jgi:iron complex outermembrane receptor protein
MLRIRMCALAWLMATLVAGAVTVSAQQNPQSSDPQPHDAGAANVPSAQTPPDRDYVFDMGKIVVVGSHDGQPGVGGSVLTSEQIWAFDRHSLDHAVNVVPGVVSTFDANGRRNETDVFVRGFGRWQVPLMLDGVRIYLPADNRLDFARFLTADIAEIQIQKGYASVLDGPGAMGGAINLVTRTPVKALEAEASFWTGGRGDAEGWNGYAMLGTRQRKY